jgi:hypothetical protein
MGKKYKYSIGDWVKFKKHYKVSSSDDKRYAYEIGMSKPILGQISGAVIRYIGKIETEEFDYHKEFGKLVPEKSIILYQIKTGMINVPYEVKEKDIEPEPNYKDFGYKLPWIEKNLSKSFRDAAANLAAERQRDAEGHFL